MTPRVPPQVTQTELRARFARALSDLYAHEVPAYQTLLDVSAEVNQDVLEARGAAAERMGDIARVTAERHGAIRVGTPTELAQVARIFGAAGMYPTGFYDLRDAKPNPIPVVSTAFRPSGPEELAANPFRVFTSLLVTDDRRFFDAGLTRRLDRFLAGRELFGPELLALADRAEAERGLSEQDARRFLELASNAFALSRQPVDREWYAELESISSVAADIGGVGSTHINHLTPRVLDIDSLYERMSARGIEMIDSIQGPPRWEGPDVLLRQTSFRALSEPRSFREADGRIVEGALRVRFGEVEARGIALTRAGRDRYDALLAEVDSRQQDQPGRPRAELAAEVWQQRLPATEEQLRRERLGFFTYRAGNGVGVPGPDLDALVTSGHLVADPIVYEDFLPRSAAGIFSSNLTGQGSVDQERDGTLRDTNWLEGVLERPLNDPYSLYAPQERASLRRAAEELGVPEPTVPGEGAG